jgi:hypothetical protein
MEPEKTIRIYRLTPKQSDLEPLYHEMASRLSQRFEIESQMEVTDGRSARITVRKFENLYKITVFPYHQVQIHHDSLPDPEEGQNDIEEIEGILSGVFEES